jgi:hypothetical protein
MPSIDYWQLRRVVNRVFDGVPVSIWSWQLPLFLPDFIIPSPSHSKTARLKANLLIPEREPN